MKTKLKYKNHLITSSNLFDLLKEAFKDHVGEENGIALNDLLEQFFPECEDWTVWKRYTYMDCLKKAIGTIRRQHGIFIVNQHGVFFVLKRQTEADVYKEVLRKDIIGMKRSIVRADEWIQEERWKSFVRE